MTRGKKRPTASSRNAGNAKHTTTSTRGGEGGVRCYQACRAVLVFVYLYLHIVFVFAKIRQAHGERGQHSLLPGAPPDEFVLVFVFAKIRQEKAMFPVTRGATR